MKTIKEVLYDLVNALDYEPTESEVDNALKKIKSILDSAKPCQSSDGEWGDGYNTCADQYQSNIEKVIGL